MEAAAPHPRSVRVNTLKTTVEDAVSSLEVSGRAV